MLLYIFALMAAGMIVLNLVQCVRARLWLGVFTLSIRLVIIALAAFGLNHARTDTNLDRNSIINTGLIAMLVISFLADVQKRPAIVAAGSPIANVSSR